MDGPFAESKEYLAGFFLIDVANIEEAIEVAKKLPGSTKGIRKFGRSWSCRICQNRTFRLDVLANCQSPASFGVGYQLLGFIANRAISPFGIGVVP